MPSVVLEFVDRLPHAGWSEGLDWHDGLLWEAYVHSIRMLDPSDGVALQSFSTPSTYGESVAWFEGSLWNVSNDDGNLYRGYVTGTGGLAFEIAGSTPEPRAWGITHDGTHLIVGGAGSPNLYVLEPGSFSIARVIVTPVDDLEDLAWDRGSIWASSYSEYSGHLLRIDPETGEILDVHSLPDPAECSIVDGVAVHLATLYVTGKNCPWIYVATMN